MRKQISVCYVLVLFLFLFGCSSVPQNNFTYVISTTSSETASINPASYIIDEGDIYGFEYGNHRSLYIFKKYDDGHYEDVEGFWTVDPDNIAYFDTTELAHLNYVNTAEMGSGKIKVYFPRTEEVTERNIYVYGVTTMVNNDPENDEYPSYFDFDPTNQEPDVYFDGTRIIADQIAELDAVSVKNTTEIPQSGYVNEVDFSSFENRISKTYVLKTKEGYYVKFSIGDLVYNATTNKARFNLYYLIEKNPDATQFEY